MSSAKIHQINKNPPRFRHFPSTKTFTRVPQWTNSVYLLALCRSRSQPTGLTTRFKAKRSRTASNTWLTLDPKFRSKTQRNPFWTPLKTVIQTRLFSFRRPSTAKVTSSKRWPVRAGHLHSLKVVTLSSTKRRTSGWLLWLCLSSGGICKLAKEKIPPNNNTMQQSCTPILDYSSR